MSAKMSCKLSTAAVFKFVRPFQWTPGTKELKKKTPE